MVGDISDLSVSVTAVRRFRETTVQILCHDATERDLFVRDLQKGTTML